MLFHEPLTDLVERGTRERGDRYYADGRVLSARRAGQTITATVRGSELYEVMVELADGELSLFCNCVYFLETVDPCKHLWATFREISSRNLLPATHIDLLILLDEDAEVADEISLSDVAVGPWKPPVKQMVSPPAWRKLFSALPNQVDFVPEVSSERAFEELIYAVELYGGVRVQSSVTLVVLGRSRKKNGEWGVPREVRVEAREIDLLPATDREILTLLNARGYDQYGGRLEPRHTLRPNAAALFLPRLSAAGTLYLRSAKGLTGPLTWDDSGEWNVHVAIELDATAAEYRIDGFLQRGTEKRSLAEATAIFPGLVILGTTLAPLQKSESLAWIDPLRQSGSVTVPVSDREALVEALLSAPPASMALPPELDWSVAAIEPKPLLSLHGQSHSAELTGAVTFLYNLREVTPGDSMRQWVDDGKVVRRDRTGEAAALKQLTSLPVSRDQYGNYRLRPGTAIEVIETLLARGWEVELANSVIRTAEEMEMSVQSGIDWFDLNGGATFGTEQIGLPRLLSALEKNHPFITLADGSIGLLPRDWLEEFSFAAGFGKQVDGKIRFQNTQAALIDLLLGTRQKISFDEKFASLRERLATASIGSSHELETFHGELRPYQRDGLGWLRFLREIGLGGCLADDMGLGKTVQVLALLDAVSGPAGLPSIVVAPRSLLFNWKSEAARFAPRLRVLEHHGSERGESTEHFGEYDLILTTYGTLRRDAGLIASTRFDYVILDEAQAIKNASSQISKAVRLLQANHRLALSGTPIENHIGELWSLFEFLNPGMLGTARFFSRSFAAKTVPPERRRLLARSIRPFILRRTKEQVAPELPARVENTLFCDLEGEQRKEYDDLREHYRQSLLGLVRKEGIGRNKMQVLEALLRLRQAACHPGLISGEKEAPSAKLDLLMDELSEILESGHKALVFSQFTSFLALLRGRLDSQRVSYCYLDGKTIDRESEVSRFQSKDGPSLFLISLKAGGVGLNLTAADYVFLLDPWWNPAVEAQAIDRTHRIGQDKPVFAYRIIARDTVEEKILELQSSKRALAGSVITDENSILQNFDLEDLEHLLA